MENREDTGEAMGAAREFTKEATDRKCPDCGGTMDFDPATGGLSCPYCEHREEIAAEEEEECAGEMDFERAPDLANCDWGAKKKVVICKACGAESVYDELQIAEVCPYCGSNQVMEEKGKETMAPGGVVPFAVTAETAAARFGKWIRFQVFCPRAAKESAKPKAFKGMYLPYWTFDAKTVSSYTARYGKDHVVGSGEKKRIETRWYPTSGTYREDVNDELVLATDRHEENLMQKIEPYNTEANKSYRPEYVAGFIAERYTIGLKNAWETAKNFILARIKGNVENKIRMETGAAHVSNLNVQTRYTGITYKYLLLPVWISSYTYKGKVYQFLVNGQTGKAGGRTPVSVIRILIAILLVIEFLALRSAEKWVLAAVALLIIVLCIVCFVKKM